MEISAHRCTYHILLPHVAAMSTFLIFSLDKINAFLCGQWQNNKNKKESATITNNGKALSM